jgi:hypothetical protein
MQGQAKTITYITIYRSAFEAKVGPFKLELKHAACHIVVNG